MEYEGKLYGKVGENYIPLMETTYQVNRLKDIVNNISFEPTLNGSVFKPKCGYKRFHDLLSDYYQNNNILENG